MWDGGGHGGGSGGSCGRGTPARRRGGALLAAALAGALLLTGCSGGGDAAVAAYFAHRLGDVSAASWPGESALTDLAPRAEALSAQTEDADVRALAEAVRAAAGTRPR